VQLGGSSAWAGSAAATYQGGAALVAFVWGVLMDRIGRRGTLMLGLSVGVLGAALSARAIVQHRLWVFLLGVAGMGMAYSALQLGRFVAAEVTPPAARGRAIATVVLGGTAGAVLGPFLVGPSSGLARRLGVDELSGPYAASAVAFVLVVSVLFVWLRPEPRELALEMESLQSRTPEPLAGVRRPLVEILALPDARAAVAALVIGQAVMVALMVITSVHMKHHEHALSSIAAVISSHVFGMYAFSAVSGRLADAWGRRPLIAAGAVALAVSCLWAPLSPQVLPLAGALMLLGLGWNFCYVGGSALLSDQLRQVERGRTQGFNDFLIGLVSALGAVSSGLVFAAVGYSVMGVLAAAVSLVPLALLLAQSAREPRGGDPAQRATRTN
jgi:MFS family permease